MALALTAAYVMLPSFQTFIAGIAPFLLLLVCPLSMFFVMREMNARQADGSNPARGSLGSLKARDARKAPKSGNAMRAAEALH